MGTVSKGSILVLRVPVRLSVRLKAYIPAMPAEIPVCLKVPNVPMRPSGYDQLRLNDKPLPQFQWQIWSVLIVGRRRRSSEQFRHLNYGQLIAMWSLSLKSTQYPQLLPLGDDDFDIRYQEHVRSRRMTEIGCETVGIPAAENRRWTFSLRGIHHSKYRPCSRVSNQVDARSVPMVVEVTALNGL